MFLRGAASGDEYERDAHHCEHERADRKPGPIEGVISHRERTGELRKLGSRHRGFYVPRAGRFRNQVAETEDRTLRNAGGVAPVSGSDAFLGTRSRDEMSSHGKIVLHVDSI